MSYWLKREAQILGFIQANPLNSAFFESELYTPVPVLDQIKKNGFDIDNILYVSCFLMVKEERSHADVIFSLFEQTIALAKQMGKKQICYMGIKEEDNHPLKPQNYLPVEPWDMISVQFRSMDVEIDMNWGTLQHDGSVQDASHKLHFYITDL